MDSVPASVLASSGCSMLQGGSCWAAGIGGLWRDPGRQRARLLALYARPDTVGSMDGWLDTASGASGAGGGVRRSDGCRVVGPAGVMGILFHTPVLL
jgi:hypothetical protein